MKKKKLKNLLFENPMTLSEIAKYYNVSRTEIKHRIKEAKELGYDIQTQTDVDGTKYYFISREKPNNLEPLSVKTDIFGVIADTHLCSRYAEEEALQCYYDEIVDRGIHQVFHAGDLNDGQNVYKGHLNDLKVFGLNNALEYCVKHYPQRKDVKTYWIGGNHEDSWYKQQGADFGELLSRYRKDLKYLGRNFKKIWLDDNIDMHLVHLSNVAYTKGYEAQKYLRMMPPKAHPDILAIGHPHKAMYMIDQDVHVLYAGCFMGTTDYIRKKGIESTIGGWIVELETEDGKKIKKLKTEFLSF